MSRGRLCSLTMISDAIIGIFMIGGIAVLASVLRVYFLHVYFTTNDPVYDTIEVSIAVTDPQSST